MTDLQVELLPFESLGDDALTYVIIGARCKGQWVFVRHRERCSWDIPAGHIERGETPGQAAGRELREETGAREFSLDGVCDYRVHEAGQTGAGRLYLAFIEGPMAPLEHEIVAIRLDEELPDILTYPKVQQVLFRELKGQLR